MTDNIITATDIVKDYSGHRALDHVDLGVPRGSVYGLLGPNGAGKTSLIRIINQITRPDSGEVLLDGKPLTPADVMHMGYLPEERGLYKKMKVADHIVFLARLKGMAAGEARREAMQWLEHMGLEEWAGKKIEALSKGMAQKVQFIGTVVHRPRLLIFDEPFSGFDPVNTELIKKEIIELNRQGATILFSTHNMASVEEVCDSFTLIDRSRVVLSGQVGQVRRDFACGQYRLTVAEDAIEDAPGLYAVTESRRSRPDGSQAVVTLAPGVAFRDALSHINDRYTLRGFDEILPSMHEIFINTVAAGGDAITQNNG